MDEGLENWRHVPGWTNYIVSDLGRVCNLYPRRKDSDGILKPVLLKRLGYTKVTLCGPGYRRDMLVHRLVATAFFGERPVETHEVNHKDCNKSNNVLDNLEWVTISENVRHAIANGLRPDGPYVWRRVPIKSDGKIMDRWLKE